MDAAGEAALPNGVRLGNLGEDLENYDDSSYCFKTPKWTRKATFSSPKPIFPEANYSQYRNLSPCELFELFFDEEVFSLIIEQSALYARYKGEISFSTNEKELKVFLGILLLSGIVPVPSRRLYWKNSPVTRNEAVYSAMRRNRFDKIMQFIHLADNTNLDDSDKYAKLRPLIRLLSTRFLSHFQPEQHLSHDEAMVEYFGRHGCKQCIRNKPIRFGYKVWCLNTDAGYLVSFDLYQGKTYEGNSYEEKTFGKCGATVLKNIKSLPDDKIQLPYSYYFDNLFTSFPLLQHLSEQNYTATGTIRDNRLKKCPLKAVSEMKKEKRGTSDFIIDKANNISLCRWMDNSVVTIASTAHGREPLSKVKRYSQKEKKNIEVDCPLVIREYNNHMGGTDRQDQNVNNYRVSIRGKKWWWSIFTWLLDVSVQNAWILHKKSGGCLPQLDFKEQIAESYLKRYGIPPKGPGRPSQGETGCKRVLDDIRFDGIEHYLIETPNRKRRRCAGNLCNKSPSSQCNKCDVGLCLSCNLAFHTK